MMSGRWRILRCLAAGAAVLWGAATWTVLGADPSWWYERGVINTGQTARDYTPVNQGQAKWIAEQAANELEEKVEGGAGNSVWALVDSFTSTNNYFPLNLGQMKYLATPFYDRLWEKGLTGAYPAGVTGQYPWTEDTADDADYAIANIGQVKFVFSFDLDRDADGLPDWWEEQYFGDTTQGADDDPDGDDLDNLGEYQNGTDPSDSDTDNDGMADGWEVGFGLNPLQKDGHLDADRDGFSNLEEYEGCPRTDPQDPLSVPAEALYVATNGSAYATGTYTDPLAEIGVAMQRATSGMRVVVMPGVYRGEGNRDLDFVGKSIMVKAVDGPLKTVIDCEGAGRGFVFQSGEGEESVVGGLTIRNGNAEYGGAIYCGSGTSPRIIRCILSGNAAALAGSALYAALYSSPIIEGSVINANPGSYAIRGYYDAAVRVCRCTVVGNEGVGVGAFYASVRIENSIIWGNGGGSVESYHPEVVYSCVEGFTGGVGCIAGPPVLCGDRWHLRSDSPCIDAGTNVAVGQQCDLEGDVAWDDPGHSNVISAVDIGADEFVDVDGDGMGDRWEEQHFGTLAQGPQADADGDGLPNLEEYHYGTDPNNMDSDGDDLTDGEEVLTYGTSPLDTDTDNDGLTDGAEVLTYGTAPLDADSDDDGLTDGAEVLTHGTDPLDADTDDDGLTDGAEVLTYGTAPLDADTDDDGLTDGWEVGYGLDPLSGKAAGLKGWWTFDDGDGLSASNAVGGGYDGVLVNMSTGSWTDGLLGGALVFDGTDDYVRIEQSQPMITGSTFSVAALVYYDAGAADDYSIAIGELTNCAGGWPGFWLGYDNYFDEVVGLVGTCGGYTYPHAGVAISGRWVRLALTYDGTDARLYVDGVEMACQGGEFEPAQLSEIMIGWAQDPTFTYHWKGKLDDVRVYSSGLSSNEIYGLSDPCRDDDGDGLMNLEEYRHGTVPIDSDTDDDGLDDGQEVLTYGTDPLDADSDDDGLSDGAEVLTHGTDPLDADSDDDGLSDGAEVLTHGTDPLDADSDDDGLSDGAEVVTHGTDPLDADSDDDGMPDGWEVGYGLDPLTDDAGGDPDGDGLCNVQEYTHGSDPQDSDTDDDGMPDGWEVSNGLDPLIDDAGGDPDGDGFSNVQEYQVGLSPHNGNDVAAAREEARRLILMHWSLIYSTPLVFTNEPGSVADLEDMREAMEALSGKFYQPVIE